MGATFELFYGAKVTSKLFLKSDFNPVEKCTLQILEKLQAKKIKVIALTFHKTGTLGEIEKMQEWRYKKLINLGIDFSASFKEQEIVFDNVLMPHGYYPPMFYRGILITACQPKGEILGAFFDSIKWSPSKVLFLDDFKVFVESVAQEMEKRNISFQGYWYKGAKRLKSQPLNQKIVQFQLDYLKQHNDILSTEEAEALLQQKILKKNSSYNAQIKV